MHSLSVFGMHSKYFRPSYLCIFKVQLVHVFLVTYLLDLFFTGVYVERGNRSLCDKSLLLFVPKQS